MGQKIIQILTVNIFFAHYIYSAGDRHVRFIVQLLFQKMENAVAEEKPKKERVKRPRIGGKKPTKQTGSPALTDVLNTMEETTNTSKKVVLRQKRLKLYLDSHKNKLLNLEPGNKPESNNTEVTDKSSVIFKKYNTGKGDLCLVSSAFNVIIPNLSLKFPITF